MSCHVLPALLAPHLLAVTQLPPPSHAAVCVCVCVCLEGVFSLRCSNYRRLLHLKVYKSLLQPFWITCLLEPFGKQCGMCAGSECEVIHRGQGEKGGQGALSEWRWRGGPLPLRSEEIRPEGLLPAPIGSHVTEESHLYINLLLLLFSSSPFISPRSLSMWCSLNEIKINHGFIVWPRLTRCPFTPSFELLPLL